MANSLETINTISQSPERPVLPTQGIERTPNPEKLNSMNEVFELLETVEGPFLMEMEKLAREKNPDWGFQKIFYLDKGMVLKRSANAEEEETKFMAENWCTVASVLLYRHLVDKLGPGIDIKLIGLNAPMLGENWTQPGFIPGKIVGHNIIEITDGKNDIYVDPTYSQIDSRWKGYFAFIEKKDFPVYYGNGIIDTEAIDVTPHINWYITSALHNGQNTIKYSDLKRLSDVIDNASLRNSQVPGKVSHTN